MHGSSFGTSFSGMDDNPWCFLEAKEQSGQWHMHLLVTLWPHPQLPAPISEPLKTTNLNPVRGQNEGPIHFEPQKLEPTRVMSRSYAPTVNWSPRSSFRSQSAPCFLGGGGQREKPDTLKTTKQFMSLQKIWTNIHCFSPTFFPQKPKLDTTLVLSGLCTQPTLLQTQQIPHGIMSAPVLPNTTLFLSFPSICIKLAA